MHDPNEYHYEKVEYKEYFPARIYIHDFIGDRIYTPQHWHRSLEILYVTEGRVWIYVNGEKILLKAGEYCFVNSGELHMLDCTSPTDFLKGVTLLISFEYIKKWIPHVEQMYFEPYEELQKEVICKQMSVIKETYEKSDKYYEMNIQIAVLKIMNALITGVVSDKNNIKYLSRKKDFLYIRHSIQYTEKNYKSSITLEDVSNYLGLTPKYFSRYFKECTGEGYHSYLSGVRLHHAIAEMNYENATITKIAMENGFPNIKSFIEQFKKKYGCTPREYKRKYIEVN